jgi:hypothetical protein
MDELVDRAVAYSESRIRVRHEGAGYRAWLETAEGVESSTSFRPPFSPAELEYHLLRISHLHPGARRPDAPEMEAARALGGRLFQAVLGDDNASAWDGMLKAAQRQGRAVRVRLDLTAATELADMPWEYLYDAAGHQFLVQVERPPIEIVRAAQLPVAPTTVAVKPPLNVLVLIATPCDYELTVTPEREQLLTALAPLIETALVDVEGPYAGPDQLVERLRNRIKPYHVLHYMAGQPPPASLFEELVQHATLRLALLASCEPDRSGNQFQFRQAAHSMIEHGLPAVIASQFPVAGAASQAMHAALYAALASGMPVDAALSHARSHIMRTGFGLEWGAYSLYLGAGAHLFDVARLSAEERIANREAVEAALERARARAASYATAERAVAREDWHVAVEALRDFLHRYPGDSSAAKKLGDVESAHRMAVESAARRDAEADRARRQQLDRMYESAQRSAESADWDAAVRDFEALVSRSPHFRDSAHRLAEARAALIREQKERARQRRLSEMYEQARHLIDEGELESALETLIDLHQEQADYRDVGALVEHLQQELRPAEVIEALDEAEAARLRAETRRAPRRRKKATPVKAVRAEEAPPAPVSAVPIIVGLLVVVIGLNLYLRAERSRERARRAAVRLPEQSFVLPSGSGTGLPAGQPGVARDPRRAAPTMALPPTFTALPARLGQGATATFAPPTAQPTSQLPTGSPGTPVLGPTPLPATRAVLRRTSTAAAAAARRQAARGAGRTLHLPYAASTPR